VTEQNGVSCEAVRTCIPQRFPKLAISRCPWRADTQPAN